MKPVAALGARADCVGISVLHAELSAALAVIDSREDPLAARKTKRTKAKAPTAQDVLDRLLESPGAKSSELADGLEADPLKVRGVLMELEQGGLVHRTGQTRGTRWFAAGAEVGARAASAAPPDEDLPPEPGDESPAPGRRGRKERVLDEHRELLGQLPDAEVARRTGASLRTVANYRKKRGIAAYAGPRPRQGAASAVAPATPAASAREIAAAPSDARRVPTGAGAWRVEIRVGGESLERFVFAATVVEAARSAIEGASSLGGEVLGISWLGQAFA
jgi:hypothetical protein